MTAPRPCPLIHPTVRRMQAMLLVVLGACSSELRDPTQPPENCFGSSLLIEPRGTILTLRDSVMLSAKPTAPFLFCFPERLLRGELGGRSGFWRRGPLKL